MTIKPPILITSSEEEEGDLPNALLYAAHQTVPAMNKDIYCSTNHLVNEAVDQRRIDRKVRHFQYSSL